MNGVLAKKIWGLDIELQAIKSRAGYYIGTKLGMLLMSRESVELYSTKTEAEQALINNNFTQEAYYD